MKQDSFGYGITQYSDGIGSGHSVREDGNGIGDIEGHGWGDGIRLANGNGWVDGNGNGYSFSNGHGYSDGGGDGGMIMQIGV